MPGIWFREGDLKNLGHCNNIIIEMKDYLIVVDANFPSGARATLADIKVLSSKPVKYVFDTHHHGDHLYGNMVWTQQGAVTMAFVGVAEELKRYEPKRWQDTAKERKDVADMKVAYEAARMGDRQQLHDLLFRHVPRPDEVDQRPTIGCHDQHEMPSGTRAAL